MLLRPDDIVGVTKQRGAYMAEEIEDGGSAFPETHYGFNSMGDIHSIGFPGISLRDYFAGQALTGYLARVHCHPGEAVNEAYFFADEMIARRQKRD